MRIDKYICDNINISRSGVKGIISSGGVSINGQTVKSPSVHVIPGQDSVRVNGKVIEYDKYKYYMMNKPTGVVSARTDSKMTAALDLIDESDKRSDLFIAGRLDRNTTGFLLITNNGDFAHEMLSPKKHVSKTYLVTLRDGASEKYAERFAEGIVLDDGYVCRPAQYRVLGEHECELIIHEGKFHQIKRMFAALGNSVTELKRTAIGNLKLDETLAPGEYRRLETSEIEEILKKL